jgi:hypothetical protein
MKKGAFFFRKILVVCTLKASTFDMVLQDMVDYQRTVAREIEARLEAKCDALTDLFAMDERGKLLNLNDM